MGNSETMIDRSLYHRFSFRESENQLENKKLMCSSQLKVKSEPIFIPILDMSKNDHNKKLSLVSSNSSNYTERRFQEFQGGFCLIR